MIQFLDGPAAGVKLMLRRAPLMLRVVRSALGKWDGLDQPADEANAREQIFVYRMDGEPKGSVHLSCRGANRAASGFYPIADYKLWPEQPADEHVRTTKAWSAWCESNRDRLTAGTPLAPSSGAPRNYATEFHAESDDE